ncbi:MAG: electron transport complex subunit E [Deltaproteobacteria bacterium]|nr:electron transport complex subunit E [Deltaproteobacteria bacterium]
MSGNNNPATAQPTLSLDTFLDGIWKENPVFIHLLGMCPVLAVSNSVINALSMGMATMFVLIMSNMVVSLVRHWVPGQIRIATFIVIIATFVTVAEYAMQAISLEVYQALGAYVPLIVVNCTILGRAESFASKNPLLPSLVDGVGVGIGFTFAIFMMGAVREVLGAGTFLEIPLFGPNFEPWVVMVLPGGGFFVLGALLLVVVWINERFKKENAV